MSANRLAALKRAVLQVLPQWLATNPNADDMHFYAWLNRKYPRLIEKIQFHSGEEPWQRVHVWMSEHRNRRE